MSQNKLRLALFDLDGTLLDTEEQYTILWGSIGRKYHPEIPDFAQRIKGSTLKRILDDYFPKEDIRSALLPDLYAHERKMRFNFFSGALDFITELRHNGIKCAVVTSSNQDKMNAVREQIRRFDSLFDHIFTAEDFQFSKPNPECYLNAVSHFGMNKDECVIFEDAPNGLEAGRRSGIFTIGVASTLTPEQISPLCDYVLTSYEGFTPEMLQEVIQQSNGKK